MKKVILLGALSIALLINVFLINESKLDSKLNIEFFLVNSAFAADEHTVTYDCYDGHTGYEGRTSSNFNYTDNKRDCSVSGCPWRFFDPPHYDSHRANGEHLECTITYPAPE